MKNVSIFLNWLSNYNLLKLFIHNWEEFNSKKFTLKQYLRSCPNDPEYWIDYAFSWAESCEGYHFWEQYHYKWINFCQDNSNFQEIEIAISIY